MWLAFPINTHQNANEKPITSVPAYQAQYILPSQPIYQTLFSVIQEDLGTRLPVRIVEVVSGHSLYLMLDWKHCHFVAVSSSEHN